MIFAQLPSGESVFLDANFFIHFFEPHPIFGPPSARLMQRIDTQDIAGHASMHLLGEAAHRLMTIEAQKLFGWPVAGIGNRLRQNPLEVKKLSQFRTAIDDVLNSRIQILTPPPTTLAAAAALCQQHGLLINDALVVAVMQAHGLTNLASADPDFNRVPWLTRFEPG